MSHPEVARRMHLAVSTVRTYSFRARRYFGVASTKEAVAKARLWDVI
jgi:DNA-binding CsgD family transcriptional regulator